jgi:hypothetical protein
MAIFTLILYPYQLVNPPAVEIGLTSTMIAFSKKVCRSQACNTAPDKW